MVFNLPTYKITHSAHPIKGHSQCPSLSHPQPGQIFLSTTPWLFPREAFHVLSHLLILPTNFCPLFNIGLQVLVIGKNNNKIKGIQIGKKEVKLSLFEDDIILYVENLTDSTPILQELIEKLALWQDTKPMPRIQWHFYTLTMRLNKETLRSQSDLQLHPKS